MNMLRKVTNINQPASQNAIVDSIYMLSKITMVMKVLNEVLNKFFK